MGRMIAIGPGGRAQAPERSGRCIPVIEAVVSMGLLDRKLLSPPCKTLDDAKRLKGDLYLAGRYWCSCGAKHCHRIYPNTPHEKNPDGGCPKGGTRVSVKADVVKAADARGREYFCVQFRVHDKQESMRWIIQRYGPDPNKWPYYSKRKKLKEE